MNVLDDLYEFSDKEDGYESTTTTTTTTATSTPMDPIMTTDTRHNRPYTTPVKKSRYQMLCEDPGAPFAKAVAGAMRRDLEDVYICEDVDRAIQLDYDGQMTEKERQREMKRLSEDIERMVERITDEKKKVIGQAAIDMVVEIEDSVERLRGYMFGNAEIKYTYEDLCRDIGETDLAFSDKPDNEALVRFITRYYIEAGITKKFGDEKYDEDDLKGVVITALDEKISNKMTSRPHQLVIENVPSFVSTGTKDQLVYVKDEVVPIKEESSTQSILRGIQMCKPTMERITSVHTSYYTYMQALFGARNDTVARNELTKNVNLGAIHDPRLNARIQSLDEPTVLRIIDTSRDYFKELYQMNATPVEKYLVTKDTIGDLQERVYTYRGVLTEMRTEYEKYIGDTLNDILVSVESAGSLLNLKTLEKLDESIRKGTVTRRQLTMSLIRDSSLRSYYQKALKEMDSSIEVSDKPKFDAFRDATKFVVTLCNYILGHDDSINEALVDMENTLDRLREKEMDMIREESNAPVRQQRATTASPIELRPDISDKIDEAYLLVQKYCAKLKDLPLSVIKSQYSLDVGLGREFARFVASLYADSVRTNPDNYISAKTHESVVVRKDNVFKRLLSGYSYTSVGRGTRSERFHITRT